MRLAAELGMKDYEGNLEFAKHSGPFRLLPLASAVLFHDKVIKQMATGRFSSDDYRRIMEEQSEITRTIKQESDARRASQNDS